MTDKSVVDNSKILILLRQFDEKEWKDLGLWLRSPIHNSSEKIIKLYECIKNKWQNTDSKLNEHVLLKSIGVLSSASQKKPITKKDRKALQQTLHLLYLQAQDFLVWKNIQQDEIQTKRRLMDTFLEKTTYTLISSI